MRSWIGVGGTPQSVIRAVRYEMPMLLAIIGGDPARFKPLADLYRGAYAKTGKPAKEIGVHSHGHVGRTDDEAREEMWPGYKATMDRIGGERGWPPMRREAFIQEIEHGSLYVGSPETVARKIAKTAGLLKLDRFQLKYSGGAQTHKTMMECIRLYGTQVAPIVRDLLA